MATNLPPTYTSKFTLHAATTISVLLSLHLSITRLLPASKHASSIPLNSVCCEYERSLFALSRLPPPTSTTQPDPRGCDRQTCRLLCRHGKIDNKEHLPNFTFGCHGDQYNCLYRIDYGGSSGRNCETDNRRHPRSLRCRRPSPPPRLFEHYSHIAGHCLTVNICCLHFWAYSVYAL